MQSGIGSASTNGGLVPDLNFRIEDAAAIAHAAVPMLRFRVRVSNCGIERVCIAALRCGIEIDARRRDYTARDRERLKDLFGESSRWAESAQTLLWTSATMIVPAFSDSVACDVLAPCSFDFNVAATKYFYGLEEGAAPLRFQFSGQVVFETGSGGLQSAEIGQRQARYALPVAAWSEMMDDFYPASVWLRLPRDTFERLYQFKLERAIATWEEVFERLLPAGEEVVN